MIQTKPVKVSKIGEKIGERVFGAEKSLENVVSRVKVVETAKMEISVTSSL